MNDEVVPPMSSPRIEANPQSSLPFGEEAKPGFRTKTAATRLTPDELAEIEAAAESAGQALSEWLRGTALCAARQRPADPVELVLAEVWAVRYTLLNLLHAAAGAAAEGRQLSPDSVLNIRDQADGRKLQQARKLLDDFFAREGEERDRMT
jgi:Mobilization protein NikA